MSIYAYFFFSYGLTAAIAFSLVALILVINKIMQLAENKNGRQETQGVRS